MLSDEPFLSHLFLACRHSGYYENNPEFEKTKCANISPRQYFRNIDALAKSIKASVDKGLGHSIHKQGLFHKGPHRANFDHLLQAISQIKQLRLTAPGSTEKKHVIAQLDTWFSDGNTWKKSIAKDKDKKHWAKQSSTLSTKQNCFQQRIMMLIAIQLVTGKRKVPSTVSYVLDASQAFFVTPHVLLSLPHHNIS